MRGPLSVTSKLMHTREGKPVAIVEFSRPVTDLDEADPSAALLRLLAASGFRGAQPRCKRGGSNTCCAPRKRWRMCRQHVRMQPEESVRKEIRSATLEEFAGSSQTMSLHRPLRLPLGSLASWCPRPVVTLHRCGRGDLARRWASEPRLHTAGKNWCALRGRGYRIEVATAAERCSCVAWQSRTCPRRGRPIRR